MTKEQLKQEFLIAIAEREEKEKMLNFVADDFVDVVTYELKAVDCKIQALLNRIKQAKMDELLNDIKKIPPVPKQNGI